MELTYEEALKINARILNHNFSDFGSKAQEAFDKLEIKHAGEWTEDEYKEFVNNMIEFLKLEDVDIVTRICTIRQVCQYPPLCYGVIFLET